MTLQELILRFRTLANDKVEPYFWTDAELVDWFNDAEQQACIRGRLLRDATTPAVCRIALEAGQATYPLHPAVYEIVALYITPAPGNPDPAPRRVYIKSPEWMDRHVADWRTFDRRAIWALQDENTLTLAGKIEDGEVLHLECYRLPLEPMALPNPDDPDAQVRMIPEIHQASHVHLIDWVLHQAFSIPDTEAFDPQRAALAEEKFTRYFGLLPDSDMRRITREDVPHHNEAVLP